VGGVADSIGSLIALGRSERQFTVTRAELEPLWLAAANDRLQAQRRSIPVLDRVATEAGIDEIKTFDDLVPLLFPHTVYKSYPAALLERGRWDGMTRWLDTVSADHVVADDRIVTAEDQDEWVAALHAAGHPVYATTGTSGKGSFVPATAGDHEFSMEFISQTITWIHGIQPAQDRTVIVLGPKIGPNRFVEYQRTMAEQYGDPARTIFLTDEPMLLMEMTRLARVNKALAAGTARPSDLVQVEEVTNARQRAVTERLDLILEQLLDSSDRPAILSGFWSQQWSLIEFCRARGHQQIPMHPDTVLAAGGGTKRADLPSDFRQQIFDFWGLPTSREVPGYGMTELSTSMPLLQDRFRALPWIITLLLDDDGQVLRTAKSGEVTGRFAFFDCAIEGRWGGLVSGDQVVCDFSTPTPSVVTGSIVRYSDLGVGSDDRLTCAGTIDAFVRGIS
jgi:hypothetical protein